MLALNLASEVATGKRNMQDAREFLIRTAQAVRHGQRNQYTQDLIFLSGASQMGDVRETGLHQERDLDNQLRGGRSDIGGNVSDMGGAQAGADSGRARTIEVVAYDFEFSPAQIVVQPGQKVRLVVLNRGNRRHGFQLDLPSGNTRLDRDLSNGDTQTITFTAPDKPGAYTFFCPLDDNRTRGMAGKLIVQRGGE
jgi:plastocyanin